MSIEKPIQQDAFKRPCQSGLEILRGKEKQLGGFTVRRLLPASLRRMVGPFIFFDHMGPADFAPGDGIDVRPHPHINLATITYLFSGEILHQDSCGSVQTITPGAINLMIAGRGIVHSERTREAVRRSGQRLEGLQLWIALPEGVEECAPSFHHYGAHEIPEQRTDTLRLRVLMGEGFGLTSPVRTLSPTFYATLETKQRYQFTLPDKLAEAAIYVRRGQLKIDAECIVAKEVAILSGNQCALPLEAEEGSELVMIGGAPLGPRHIEWNFVSSREERISHAKADWQAGRFPLIPTDREEFIPLP